MTLYLNLLLNAKAYCKCFENIFFAVYYCALCCISEIQNEKRTMNESFSCLSLYYDKNIVIN